jgi:hypothetical protein
LTFVNRPTPSLSNSTHSTYCRRVLLQVGTTPTLRLPDCLEIMPLPLLWQPPRCHTRIPLSLHPTDDPSRQTKATRVEMDSSSTAGSRVSGCHRAQKPALAGSSRRAETVPAKAVRGPWASVPVAVEEPKPVPDLPGGSGGS